MKRLLLISFSLLFAAAATSAHAQSTYAASADQRLSITTGVMGSIFQSDYEGAWVVQSTSNIICYPDVVCVPAAQKSQYPLFGIGAYVDLKYNRWIQIEAEGRWQRFNQFNGSSQDNYLIGPRVPIHRIWKAEIYGKALIGEDRMTFSPPPAYLMPTDLTVPNGRYGYTAIAFGGGADIKINNRWTLRFPDLEYQYLPSWNGSTLKPYGASIGIGYRAF